MKKIDRFDKYMSFRGLNDNKVTVQLGLSNGVLAKSRKENRDLSDRIIEKIKNFYTDLNIYWLETGEGEMLLKTENSESKVERVPLYNFDAVAGLHRSNDVFDTAENIIATIPFLNAIKGDVAITVTGDSMLPKYESGSILLLRPVDRWREYFGYGNCFVLLLEDGRRVLKQIQKVNGDNEKVLCVSINEKYPAEELPKSMIVKVFKVIACLNNEGF